MRRILYPASHQKKWATGENVARDKPVSQEMNLNTSKGNTIATLLTDTRESCRLLADAGESRRAAGAREFFAQGLVVGELERGVFL